MSTAKIAISLDRRLLARVDQLVRGRAFTNRSQAIQVALAEKISRMERSRLARECGQLDPREERALAEEGLSEDATQWPEY